jgi:hypothetical protein
MASARFIDMVIVVYNPVSFGNKWWEGSANLNFRPHRRTLERKWFGGAPNIF